MKRFLRSKLVLSLAALIMIATAIVIPLSGSISHSHAASSHPHSQAAPSRGKLVILLQGINTELQPQEASSEIIPTFDVPGGIVPFLQKQPSFKDAVFLPYSYNGVDTSTGEIKPYFCQDTWTHRLVDDVMRLDDEITTYLKDNPNTDVYLIGHSLGGVVAFGYLGFIRAFKWTLPNGGQLKAVITLDSPIGGVTNDNAYFASVDAYAHSAIGCPFLSTVLGQFLSLESVNDLVDIFNTAPYSSPQGGDASEKQVLFLGKFLSNQQLAQEAKAHGIPILTVGNLHDILWRPNVCGINKNFMTTQWVEDQENTSGIYGRDFTSGPLSCIGGAVVNLANHFAVLTNTDVQTGIGNFLTPPVGGEPVPLKIAPTGP